MTNIPEPKKQEFAGKSPSDDFEDWRYTPLLAAVFAGMVVAFLIKFVLFYIGIGTASSSNVFWTFNALSGADSYPQWTIGLITSLGSFLVGVLVAQKMILYLTGRYIHFFWLMINIAAAFAIVALVGLLPFYLIAILFTPLIIFYYESSYKQNT